MNTAGQSLGQGAATAREQAGAVADTAARSARDVADTAREHAGAVVDEAVAQATDLLEQARTALERELTNQGGVLAGNLRRMAEDAERMAQAGETATPARSLLRELSRRCRASADYLEGRRPQEVLSDVQDFGRRRPVALIAGAALAGFAVARLAKTARSAPSVPSAPSAPSAPAAPAAPALPGAAAPSAPSAFSEQTPVTEVVSSHAAGAETVEPYPTTPLGRVSQP